MACKVDAAQCPLLLGEPSLLLGFQCPCLGTVALSACLAPGVDDIHALGDAGLDDSGELVAVAGHAPTLRRARPAWHRRPWRT